MVTSLFFVTCLQIVAESVVPFCTDAGRFGIKSVDGEIITEPNYSDVSFFDEGIARYQKERQSLYGYLKRDGSVLLMPQFERATHFRSGFAVVRTKHNGHHCYGIVSREGARILFSPEIVVIGEYSDGLLQAKHVDAVNLGFIDHTGSWRIEPAFGAAQDFHEGCAAVKNPELGEWGFVDRTGTPAFERTFALEPLPFHDDIAGFQSEKQSWGFVRKDGETLIEPQYVSVGNFSDGVANVRYWTKFGARFKFIRKDNSEAFPGDFEFASPFVSERSIVRHKGLFGAINPMGVWKVEAKYSELGRITQDIAIGTRASDGRRKPVDLTSGIEFPDVENEKQLFDFTNSVKSDRLIGQELIVVAEHHDSVLSDSVIGLKKALPARGARSHLEAYFPLQFRNDVVVREVIFSVNDAILWTWSVRDREIWRIACSLELPKDMRLD